MKPTEKYRKHVDPTLVISFYHKFKREPNKVFVISDFMFGNRTTPRTYFHLLKVLGIIEEVSVIYKTGLNDRCIRTNIKGYKLLNREKKKWEKTNLISQ